MRLLTYNIHKGIGGHDRLYRLHRVLSVIAEERADLLCLQEVTRGARRTRRDDQPRLLAEAAGAAASLFQLNVRWKEGGYGNLLLSRWPLLEHHDVPLCYDAKKPRGAQVAVVETPEGRLLVTNWHLGLSAAERRWQIARLLEHPAFRRRSHLPMVLAGDANDGRDLLAREVLSRHGFSQASAPPRRFRTYPAYVPLRALDKVFFRGGVRLDAARAVRSRLARRASDHLPVAADFRLG